VKSCTGCQTTQHAPTLEPLHPWEWPETPWQRVHIDFAGPFINRMFFVMMDAHSKWHFVCLIPLLLINSLNFSEVNVGPLSLTICEGTPFLANT
jgi:hypothetical protein